jgi:nucleoside 2-deoxyribosyltransferase
MSRVYWAAAVFTAFERSLNARIGTALRAEGFDVFLPQEVAAPPLDGGWDLRVVFEECRRELTRCDLVAALLDGAELDSGVAWELGYAAANGTPSIGFRTDFRKHESHGVNIMIEFSTRVVYLTGYRTDEATAVRSIVTTIVESAQHLKGGTA